MLTHDEPTTIDLHGAKPIDFTASRPEEVAEDLRQSGAVLAKWAATCSACGALVFLAFTLMAWQHAMPGLGDRDVMRNAEWTIAMAAGSFGSWRRYRRLKSQAQPR